MKIKRSSEEIEQIMDSMDHLPMAKAPDFFYAKLRSKMEVTVEQKQAAFNLKPLLLTVACAIFIFLNFIAIKQPGTTIKEKQEKTTAPSIEDFANTYNF